jgi:ATP-dependent 26S proteasome regulatory subunit
MDRKLLRASSFCQSQHPPILLVSIEAVESSEDDFSVYGPVDLLVDLSVRSGDVVWLISEENSQWQSLEKSDSCLRIPAVLRIDESPQKNKHSIRVPPCLLYIGTTSCRIQACIESIPLAKSISVSPIGRPVAHPFCLDSILSSTYPPIDKRKRLVSFGTLLSFVHDDHMFVYFVISKGPVWTTPETEWTLESETRFLPVSKLPPIDRTRSFYARKKYRFVPHPSLEIVKDHLRIPLRSISSHKILHIVGTLSNHVDICIESAASAVGRRYMKVNGLAAFAHAAGKSVTTGSIQDKVAGCQAALDHAFQCAPCVLHFINFEDEISQKDHLFGKMFEMRLWTLMTTILRQRSNESNSLRMMPPVIVVLSTRTPLAIGPISQNLVYPTVLVEQPNEEYSRFLWEDQRSFAEAWPFLAGQSANDIVKWKKLWCCSSESLVEFLSKRIKSKVSNLTGIPDVSWSDIGGLDHVRREIEDAIELPLRHPNLFCGTRRSGILLYGPPGTGKTLVAKAVANECNLPFFSVKGPELLGSYVGESETNVRNIFAKAQNAASRKEAKCAILFFDELDSLAPRRGGVGDGGGVMERVVATLLTELDRNESVILIGATNRPDLLDPALLRPGRLDRKVFLGLSSRKENRAQVLAARIRKFPLEEGVDSQELAASLVDQFPRNLSGADFSAIANEALMISLNRLCAQADREVTEDRNLEKVLESWDENKGPIVTAADLHEASKKIVPSVNVDDTLRYERLQEEFSSAH